MTPYSDPNHIIITGASSGLGAALARVYARDGIHLGLTGRNKNRLQHIADECKKYGAVVDVFCHDVCDAVPLATWLNQRHDMMPVDLVIANAGISAGSGGNDVESADQAAQIFAVNLNGVINSITPLLPAMMARRHGQVAIIASIAGLCGMPSAPAYSASKGAVRLYGDALRGLLRPHQVAVSVICPGFIRTPMTDVNDFPMPMLMDADHAARIIQRNLAKNKPMIAFPWPLYALVRVIAGLPAGWRDRILGTLPGKKPL